MQEKSDILNGGERLAYDVPEGYFDGLKARLTGIPERRIASGPMQRIAPYLALAACFVGMMIAGTAVLRSTAGEAADEYSEMAYAALSQVIQSEEYLPSATVEQDSITDEDVINYLIDSGASTELIEYTGLLARK